MGIRPQWLVLEERQAEICDAINSYDERALLAPDEWLLELTEIQRQLAELRQPTNELPPQQPVPEPDARATEPRRFVSISRTFLSPTESIIDAIDDEGVAWTRKSLPIPPQPSWKRIDPLPAREVPQF